MLKKAVFTFVVFSLLISCVENNHTNGKVIARVGDYNLYQSDIEKLMRTNVSGIDSVAVVEAYINRWARKKVIIQKAMLNLNEFETDFNRLVEEYREDLLTNAYRTKLVSQYLDTIVDKSEIEEFFNKNKENFLLNQNLLMLRYADFPSTISNKKDIIKLFKSDDEEDIQKLEELCYQYSSRFGIIDSSWVALDEVKLNMPELRRTKNKELLKKGVFIELQDSLNLYLTRILDVRKKNDISPVSFVDGRIKNIILNRRKLELLRKMEDQILKDAIKNNEFETFK